MLFVWLCFSTGLIQPHPLKNKLKGKKKVTKTFVFVDIKSELGNAKLFTKDAYRTTFFNKLNPICFCVLVRPRYVYLLFYPRFNKLI